LLYTVIKAAFNGQPILVNKPEGPGQLATYLSRSSFGACMDLSMKEDILVIAGQALFGIYREDLINGFISTTKNDLIENYEVEVEEDGIIFQPSALGVELFLWANGRGEIPVWEFLNSDIDLGGHFQLDCKPEFRALPERFPTSSPLSQKKTKKVP
jgi:hypothetical protein